MLYDLIFDPNETHNLIHDAGHRDVLADMRKRLNDWMRATSDPLLRGNIPAPQGARVNDPNGISPSEPVQTV
jgi:hypothetical protein